MLECGTDISRRELFRTQQDPEFRTENKTQKYLDKAEHRPFETKDYDADRPRRLRFDGRAR